MDSFDDALTAFSSTTPSTRTVSCTSSRGIPSVLLRGAVPGPLECIVDETYGKTPKECRIVIISSQNAACGDADIIIWSLTGNEAAQWKKFLKGQGCQDAMALLP